MGGCFTFHFFSFTICFRLVVYHTTATCTCTCTCVSSFRLFHSFILVWYYAMPVWYAGVRHILGLMDSGGLSIPTCSSAQPILLPTEVVAVALRRSPVLQYGTRTIGGMGALCEDCPNLFLFLFCCCLSVCLSVSATPVHALRSCCIGTHKSLLLCVVCYNTGTE